MPPSIIVGLAWLAILGLGALIARIPKRGSIGAFIVWSYVLVGIGVTAAPILSMIGSTVTSITVVGQPAHYYATLMFRAL